MKRFLIATLCAVALGLGTSNKAHAQIVYGYTTPVPGGVESTTTVANALGTQTFTNFYSPFTGTSYGQSTVTNNLGGAFTQTYGYNPWTGLGFGMNNFRPNSVFRSPITNPFVRYTNPFTGITYSVRRR
jgi:hypothetical protein